MTRDSNKSVGPRNDNGAPRRLDRARGRALIPATALLLVIAAVEMLSTLWSGPQARAPHEVPVTFWTWQLRTPDESDVRRATERFGSRLLFLRAGQIDYHKEKLRRIRSVEGPLPTGIDLHLVYNATPGVLAAIERVEVDDFASVVAESFGKDQSRAARDNARVTGIQLDIDVPTRLLPRYERILRSLRGKLESGIALSITGLSTWMTATAVTETLNAADFWILQCYGAMVPEKLDDPHPIASARQVAAAIDRARAIGRPFYAGLAAYGYAIRYSRSGDFREMSGSLDPALAASNNSLKLIERRSFESSPGAGHWRIVYRALEDCLVAEIAMRAGEYLMFDLPSTGGLRACARKVRERGGAGLLGICVFRLPAVRDVTTLTLEEVSAALSDSPAAVANDVSVERASIDSGKAPGEMLTVQIRNAGSMSALPGRNAFTVDLSVPPGILRDVQAHTEYETLSATGLPCSPRRASTIRLTAASWRPGDGLSVSLRIKGNALATMKVLATIATAENSLSTQEITVPITRGNRL